MNSNQFTPFPVLHTERLTLRQLRNTDWPGLLQLRNDPSVNRYLDRARQKNEQEMIAFIERLNSNISAGQSMYWVIFLNQSQDLIGTISLWNFSEDEKTAELGYELFPAHQKKGLMREAITALLPFVFDTCAFTRLEAQTHRENISSSRLLKHFDFRLVKNKTDSDNPDIDFYELTHK